VPAVGCQTLCFRLGQLVVILTAGIDLSVGSISGLCCVLVSKAAEGGRTAGAGGSGGARDRRRVGQRQRLLLTKLQPAASVHPTLGMDERGARAGAGDFGRLPIFGVALEFPFLGGRARWAGFPAPVIVVVVFCVVFHVFLTRHHGWAEISTRSAGTRRPAAGCRPSRWMRG